MLSVANLALRRYLRERSNLFFVFVLPLLIIFLVGYTSGSRGDAPLAIVGGTTEIGEAVLAHLPVDGFVLYDDLDDALRAVGDVDAIAVAVFPLNADEPITFRAKAGVGLAARSQLERAVASENQQIAIVRQAALVDIDEQTATAALGEIEPTTVRSETIGTVVWRGLDDLDASALTQVVLFMFLSALTASSFLVRDRTLGMVTRKAAAPISVTRLVLGETLGRFWISLFQGLLIVIVTSLVFGVEWGHPLATGAILLAFGLVATGFGILLGTAFNNSEVANGVGIVLALVLAALGGAMAPVEIFPDTMQTIATLTPHYWAIDGLQVSLTGGSLADVLQPLAILIGIAIGVIFVATTLFRRRAFASR